MRTLFPHLRIACCWLIACSCLMFLGAKPMSCGAVETRYIKPALEVPIRASQANNARILAMLPVATPVELVEAGRDWSRIKMQDGKVGWARSNFLSTAPYLPGEHFQEGTGNAVLVDTQTKFKELGDENNRLKKELSACGVERSSLADKYAVLTSDPNSALHARNALEANQQQLKETEEKLAQTQIEQNAMKKNQSILWFLAGGGSIFLGWLLGRFSATNRKKRQNFF